MGGKGVDNSTTPLTIREYFEKLLTYALFVGMSYDLYWYGDPFALKNYIDAYEMKLANNNNMLWLEGYYVYNAVGCLVPVLNPFSKEHKARRYLEQPIPITQKEIDEVEEKRVNRIINHLDNLVGKKLG